MREREKGKERKKERHNYIIKNYTLKIFLINE